MKVGLTGGEKFRLSARATVWVVALGLLCGCASSRPKLAPEPRVFDFQKDTFAYPNELLWVYSYDTNGKWTSHRRDTKPAYAQHCFVVARSARQFFENARFEPRQPKTSEEEYQELIRRVVRSSPRKPLSESQKIVIPGYHNLREFSEAQETLLKQECGGAWQCYFQRGNWRMIFPFTQRQREQAAARTMVHLKESGPVIAHLSRFPQLTINHAVLIYDVRQTAQELQFIAYDPNNPEEPISVVFDRSASVFSLAANRYFAGGKVDVYEVYWKWDY